MPTLLLNRVIVRLSAQEEAEDVRAFLQGLVTNDVAGELPVYAGLLSAQGKTLFDFLVWADGSDLLLDCEAAVADELVKRLSLYRLRRKIGIAVDDKVAVHWSAEPVAGAVPDPRLPELGWRWLAAADDDQQPADAEWLEHRLSLGCRRSGTN